MAKSNEIDMLHGPLLMKILVSKSASRYWNPIALIYKFIIILLNIFLIILNSAPIRYQ